MSPHTFYNQSLKITCTVYGLQGSNVPQVHVNNEEQLLETWMLRILDKSHTLNTQNSKDMNKMAKSNMPINLEIDFDHSQINTSKILCNPRI